MKEEKYKQGNIFCELGVLSRPDGSAFLCHGETAVLAGVYGPIEAKVSRMSISKSIVETYFRPKGGLPGIGDRLYEAIIQKVCDTALATILYPRSSIVIVTQEMQNCGGIIGCAVNAACLALLNAGIDMKCMIAAVTCTLDGGGTFLVHPDRISWEQAQAKFVFVFESTNKKIVACHSDGTFSEDDFKEAVQLSKEASEKIFDFYKIVLKTNCKG